MPPVPGYAPAPEVDLLAAYDEHCDQLGLISVNLRSAARTFLRRWPDPQAWAGEPLEVRLTASHPTRSFVMFLMLAGHLRPGYDYLIRRKLPVFSALKQHPDHQLRASARCNSDEPGVVFVVGFPVG